MIFSDAALRWMYRSGRPNRIAALLNRISVIVGSTGIWSRLVTLEVRGRRSGKTFSLPLVVVTRDGQRYLVSMLGENANWVANVRAAGGRATLRHRGRETVHLEEVPAMDRAPVLKDYLRLAPGARPHMSVDFRAPVAAFESIAAKYPIFRVHSQAR
ncbi:MAG TPA: nitroreductase/quinone reductase family protein [Polyangiaceae bacterium]|nr:nitroreductase/quinone reductase family protein [Polyangiaceae bacterium]